MHSYYTGINILSEIIYQEKGIAEFPMLKKFPLHAGFSWGKDSPNMSYKRGNMEDVAMAHKDFFTKLNLPTNRMLIDPSIDETNQILEVQQNLFTKNVSEIITGSNTLFTKDRNITLMVHPGDCPSAVIFAKDNVGENILGLVHLGRKQTDQQLPTKAVMYLERLGINPQTINIAISPSVSQSHYAIPKDKQEEILPNAEKWGKYIEIKKQNNKIFYYLDMQGYIVEQFLNCDVKPENIQLYAIDTYEAAEKGESFSHRYATQTKQPEKDGRFLLAASLS